MGFILGINKVENTFQQLDGNRRNSHVDNNSDNYYDGYP
jgi:hypothetical protein